jgi:hypothetical protein
LPPLTVWMTRLFCRQPGHHGRPLVDVHDHETTRFWQVGGDLPYLPGSWDAVSALAPVELTGNPLKP